MYRVLVPVDTDEDRALAQAEYVADLPHADDSVEAVLLFVFGQDGEAPGEMQQFKTASRVGSIRRAREFLEERGVSVDVVDEGGDTVDDILREADANDVSAIVMGGRKRSPVGKIIFGSVTQSVILNAERPVVVTGAVHE